MRPEAVVDQVKADPALTTTLAEYDTKRSATPYTADGQLRLALWAEERGLKEQSKAHLTAVVRLDPKRDTAWKRLGYTKHDGRWATEAELAASKADAEAQKAADRKWKPLLEKWKAQLSKPAHRAEAEANLLTVTDPRASAIVAHLFLNERLADQMVAARLFGQIDSVSASRSLVLLAVFSSAPEVRRVAVETLRNRDPREFADLLITQLRKSIRYEIRPVGGPGSPGFVFIEGKQFNTQRVYAPPAFSYTPRLGDVIVADNLGLPAVQRLIDEERFSTGRITGSNLLKMMQTNQLHDMMTNSIDPNAVAVLQNPAFGSYGRSALDHMVQVNQDLATSHVNKLRTAIHDVGLAEHKNPTQFGFEIFKNSYLNTQIPIGQMMLEAQKTAAAAQQQLQSDVQTLDATNQQIRQRNDQIQQVLTSVTGENYGDDAQAWKNWWINQLGYRSSSTEDPSVPTFIENVPLAHQPQPVAPTFSVSTGPIEFARFSCFGAGTLVRTMSGPLPIERLKVGDLVLTQSTSTGALGYQPILVTHHNPPSATFRIKLGDDVIVASHFHRFWVARRGWVMARDVKAGDPVRTLGGIRAVDSVESGKVELVYNLDIAEDADFFAGTAAALVHDNSLPDPRLVPFDLPKVEAKVGASR